MARWLPFWTNTTRGDYKPGKQNLLDDAISREPNFELPQVTTLSSSIADIICTAYARDDHCVALLHALITSSLQTQTYLCQHAYEKDYIDIQLIDIFFATERMLMILLVSWLLTTRNLNIASF